MSTNFHNREKKNIDYNQVFETSFLVLMEPTFFRFVGERERERDSNSRRQFTEEKEEKKGEMVSSAIFGAAAGTGLALVVAMTIVVYRYYAVKRKGKYWSNLDRWPDPPGTKRPEERQKDCSEHCHDASSSHVLNCWRKEQKNYYTVQTRVSTIYVSSTSLCLLLGIKLQNRNTGESRWMERSWRSFLTNINVLYNLSIRLLNSRFEFDWY